MPYADAQVNRERAGENRRANTRNSQDIGELPECEDPARREACRNSIRLMAEKYFPEAVFLAWSDDQLEAIRIMEAAILEGGKFALAMPRGSGKTTLCIIAILWAILFHHKAYGVLIGANEKCASRLIDKIKKALRGNELLHADFPLETLPFKLLENEARAAGGQRYKGERTAIQWTEFAIVFPVIEGSSCSQSVIQAVSIMAGEIRGTSWTFEDGQTTIRPDLTMIDDPQTKESAKAPGQCEKRRDIINSDIMEMCGPTDALSALMPCTVICKDDLADQMLDRKKQPEWRGRKFKALYAWPTNMKLWDEYYSMRCRELEEFETHTNATAFYREHQAEMDAGAEVAWPVRFKPKKGEISGIQHCLHVYLEKPDVFAAEYQQDPQGDADSSARQIEEKDLKLKVIRIAKGKAPTATTKLTAFIDVQKRALYYMVCAFNQDFSGHIVEYGAFPDQKRSFYQNIELPYPLEKYYEDRGRTMGLEGQLYAAIEDLQMQLLGNEVLLPTGKTVLQGREWLKEDGTIMHIEKLLIDVGWGPEADVVYESVRRTKWPTIVAPSQGRGLGAKDTPMEFYNAKPNEEVGFHWLKTVGRMMRTIPYYSVDVNYWKSFAANRIFTGVGDPGSLTIAGGLDGMVDNRLLFAQLTAEYREARMVGVRTVDEWHAKPQKFDNHWWDCLVGCHVAASMLNAALPSAGGKKAERKRENPPPRRSA